VVGSVNSIRRAESVEEQAAEGYRGGYGEGKEDEVVGLKIALG
jgi:hypothetical protein